MDSTIRIGLIYGSTRHGRFCDVIGRWTAAQVGARTAFEVVLIDPLALSLPQTHVASDHETVAELASCIGACDGFIVVTPEYNHGYPAPLKFLIDLVREQWFAKPVAFVSYGGTSGGLRAVEQLRLVFAELHAVSVRDTVSFASAHRQFDESGRPLSPDKHEKSMQLMLDQLNWWAKALIRARNEMPYGIWAA